MIIVKKAIQPLIKATITKHIQDISRLSLLEHTQALHKVLHDNYESKRFKKCSLYKHLKKLGY